jgi:hypothetical protein
VFNLFWFHSNTGLFGHAPNSSNNPECKQPIDCMSAKRKKKKNTNRKPMLFSPLNYKLMGLGVLLVIIGFTIMRLENEVYGFISLYISPVLILGGYLTVIWAILKRDHKLDNPSSNPSA